MSRSGYNEDYGNEDGALAMWRGVIASATRGKRGQRFFRDLVVALDAVPDKRLIANEFQRDDGGMCALGSLAKLKGISGLEDVREDDYEDLGEAFDIAHQLAQEVMFMNDEARGSGETRENRWLRMRAWAASQIREKP